ncbi:MAG: DUF2973 domain-containing protein [Synechococcaceae cyanobacterium]|nr:DUF2973 domain-containing protein [Synechococcaceae cyanobacterium]
MSSTLSELFPLLYAACFLLLLWQAFRIMGQGFSAMQRTAPAARPDLPRGDDRTGRVTIHPELLDADGRITSEDLLTVRFGGDNEQSPLSGDRG